MPKWPLVGLGVAIAGVALLSHTLMTLAADRPWAVAALFAPLVLGLAGYGLQRRHGPSLLACAGLVALLVWELTAGRSGDVHRLYVLQHAGIHGMLAWAFGSTLRPGSTALITALAERLHTDFTPAMRHYTRRLTALWVGYFIGMALLSVALYQLAPWPVWSAFANLVTPLAALALFTGEPLWRHWRHPEFERVSLARVARAYRTRSTDEARS